MRLAIFSAWNSRSLTRGSLQGLAALSALVVLTGAKGQGCGGTVVEEPQPPPVDCAPGYHQETVCAPCEVGDMCEEQCVPDSVCPPDTVEQWTCPDIAVDDSSCDEEPCPVPPPTPECFLECVAPNPCGDGFHQEWSCDPGPPVPVPVDLGGGDAPSEPVPPPPPSDCSWTCVPDGICPPGSYEQTVCTTTEGTSSSSTGGGSGGAGGGFEEPPYPGDTTCWTECVPAAVCPPGTMEQTVCSGTTTSGTTSTTTGTGGSGPGSSGSGGGWGGTGGAGGAGGGWGGAGGGFEEPTPVDPSCWTECVPFPEPVCPPGTVEQVVCSGGTSSTTSSSSSSSGGGGDLPYPEDACWVECVPQLP